MPRTDRLDTLPDAILAAASARPDLPVTFCSPTRSETVALADLVDRAARSAAAFSSLGIRPGDSVAVQVPSRLEGVVAQAAAVLAGAALVPVVPTYGPHELGFILRESRARLLVTLDRWGRRDFVADLQRVGDCPDLSSVAVIGDLVPPGYLDWAQLVRRSEPLTPPTPVTPDDVCLLVYTSGTTGKPKGVQHTHATLLAELRTRTVSVDAFPSDGAMVRLVGRIR
jgi:acyl-coenzyme A synthetase/AMP-(fatty) acid ligase